MLKISPRFITIAVLLFFLSLIGIQHLVYFIRNQVTDSDLELVENIAESIPFLAWIERADYDMHLRYHRPGPIHPDVTIVEVSERSMQELGQFPFPRKIYSKLIKNLEKMGAKVVAFDITFPEKERNPAASQLKSILDDLERIGPSGAQAAQIVKNKVDLEDGDAIFGKALKESKLPSVIGFTFSGKSAVDSGAANISKEQKELFQTAHSIFRSQANDNSYIHSMSKEIPILPHLELLRYLGGNSTLGSFIAEPGPDSVIRTVAVVITYEGTAFTSLSVRAVAAYLGVEPALFGDHGLRIKDREETGKMDVPLNPQGSAMVRYYGGERKIKPIEFSDVISDDPKVQERIAKKLNGKIVFVGVTAVGLKDIRANPFSKDYPGVEVHATFASNILTHSYLEKDQRYFQYGYIFILLLGFMAAFLVYGMHPVVGFLLSIFVLALFQLGANEFFFNDGLVVPTIIPCISALSVFFSGLLYRYFTEEKEKKRVRSAFSRYVSGPVMDEILKDQSKLKLGGQKKDLTVMFCDLVGFTKLSESLDPTTLTMLLNEYFTRMTKIILARRGTLDKYMGDAVMCFWGAPIDIKDHAVWACQAALEMSVEIDQINRDWSGKYNVKIGMRIGIHSGEMNVGNMGSEQVFSYTVMGDNVNLGSRLEGVNNVYGTTIICSRPTKEAAGDKFRFRLLDKVRVKGKEEAVEIYELDGFQQEGEDTKWISLFEKGWNSYAKGEWDKAEEEFYEVIGVRPEDMPTKVFLERIKELKQSQPKDWDGIWTFTSK